MKGLQACVYGFTTIPTRAQGVQILGFVDQKHQTCAWARPADTNAAPKTRARATLVFAKLDNFGPYFEFCNGCINYVINDIY